MVWLPLRRPQSAHIVGSVPSVGDGAKERPLEALSSDQPTEESRTIVNMRTELLSGRFQAHGASRAGLQ
jgi:hypothetical protein